LTKPIAPGTDCFVTSLAYRIATFPAEAIVLAPEPSGST
jgi:hypothetical protein